jgi:hypothetical protein
MTIQQRLVKDLIRVEGTTVERKDIPVMWLI